MKPTAAFVTGAGTVAVLAVGLQIGIGSLTHGATAATADATSSSSSTSTAETPASTATATPAPSASAATTDTSASSSSSGSGITGTFTGADVADDAGYGDVQVQVVIENGTITDVVTLACNATKGRSQACPMLRTEAISAQSAKISNISGATFTSDAYMRSMQSALDKAGYAG